MASPLDRHLETLRATIPTIAAGALREHARRYVVVDVREQAEVETGVIPGALAIARGVLETTLLQRVPDPATELVLYCAGGVRSLLAADSLRTLGYTRVTSLAGGITAWKDAGYPLVPPGGPSPAERARYAAQVRLAEVGDAGQQRLREARVLLVGAGGLGSPAALYLAAAGIGTLGVIDDDRVELGNLQRQVLHATERIGMRKVDSAQMTLRALNPTIHVETYPARLDRTNVDEIVPRYDLVVDGTDNFQTRYLINDACLKHGKRNIHGAVYWFEGQLTTFCADAGPCYRCVYPEPPPSDLAPSCAEGGVLGVLPGLIGVLQATEVLKLVLRTGDDLVGRLVTVDAKALRFAELELVRDPDCRCGGDRAAIAYEDYETLCSRRST